MNEQQFKYYAFISYCTADEKWAKWLHHHLEHYHIPTHLCSEYPDLPKKIRPVFWYKVDLSGTKLKRSLEKELDVSNYLIVICSPDSAKSDWVNDEISSFISKHGSNRIIPLIVAGEPKSDNNSLECLPPAIRNLPREEELRGISIPKAGKYHALVDVVATMFNVHFDSLWQRHRRRQLRHRTIGTLIALIVLICGIFAFDYFRTSRSYYSNYEFCLGLPVGIDPLEKSDLKSTFTYYVFESSRGKLRRVYNSNPFGHPIDENSSWTQFRTAILDLAYEGDRLSSITFSDANSNPQYKLVYSDDYRRADIKDVESGDATSMFKSSSSIVEAMNGNSLLDLNNIFYNTKSQVARYAYDYDADGYIKKIHFKRYNGSNETGYDDSGISGIEYERDAFHRVTKKSYLDENGEYMADKMGCAGCEYAYNNRGDLVYERFFGLDGTHHLSDMGYAISHLEYDYPSHAFSETHLGIDENPIMTISKYHRVTCEIREDSIISRYFDTALQPTLMHFPQRNVGLFHKSIAVYDKNGNNVEVSFYGVYEEPCYDMNRVHKLKSEYDDKGRCIRNITLNTDGQRQLCTYEISEIGLSYVGDSNNIESIEYFRRPGIRANVMGIGRRVFTYSGSKIVKSECFDSNNLPSCSPVNLGVPIVLLEYDDFGNVSDIWLKDAVGSTQNLPDDYVAHIKASYNNGNCIELRYLNKHGRPVTLPYGYSTQIMEYNTKGQRTATEYLDTLWQPAQHPNLPYTRIDTDYNTHGDVVITRTLDHNHKPIVCFDGWAVKKEEFKDNLLTKITSYGEDGEPILARNVDAHIKEFEYDKCRRLISEKYFGLDEQPILNSSGVHEVTYRYNSCGLLVEMAFYDTNNKPVSSTQNFHKKTTVYDNRHNPIEEKLYDKNGNITENSEFKYAYTVAKYNPQGQLLSMSQYGVDSMPVNNSDGVHMILNKYNSAGDQILHASLDKELRPVPQLLNNDYYAISYNKIDDNGIVLGSVWYGRNFIEHKMAIPLFENGVNRGMLLRENLFTAKLLLPDGTLRELSLFSDSQEDEIYIDMLDSISDSTLDEVKRLIKDAI